MSTIEWLTLGVCAWIWNGQQAASGKVALAYVCYFGAILATVRSFA